MSATGTEERVLYEDDTHRIVSVGSVLLSVNWVPPAIEGPKRVLHAVRDLHRAFPGGVSLVLAPNAPRPALSPRAAAQIKQTTSSAQQMLCCATVWVERRGFGAAVVRSLATGVLHLRPARFPVEITSSSEEAAAFVARHASTQVDPHSLAGRLALFATPPEHRH